jgi:hypothetical protein
MVYLVKMSHLWRITMLIFVKHLLRARHCFKYIIYIITQDGILTRVGVSIPLRTDEKIQVQRGYETHSRPHLGREDGKSHGLGSGCHLQLITVRAASSYVPRVGSSLFPKCLLFHSFLPRREFSIGSLRPRGRK